MEFHLLLRSRFMRGRAKEGPGNERLEWVYGKAPRAGCQYLFCASGANLLLFSFQPEVRGDSLVTGLKVSRQLKTKTRPPSGVVWL